MEPNLCMNMCPRYPDPVLAYRPNLCSCSRSGGPGREETRGEAAPRLGELLADAYFSTTVFVTMGIESCGRPFWVTNRPGAE